MTSDPKPGDEITFRQVYQDAPGGDYYEAIKVEDGLVTYYFEENGGWGCSEGVMSVENWARLKRRADGR